RLRRESSLGRVLCTRRLPASPDARSGPGASRENGLGVLAVTLSSSSKNPRVFLSYASDDARSAERLRPLLKLAGFDPWLESEILSTQEPWEAAMARAITSSDFVVALLSRGTRSGRQEQELRTAVRASQGARGSGKLVVLPCTVTGTRTAAFEDMAP